MNRKLIAVAVAGALGLPALAVAQSTVQIYGRAHVEYSWTKHGSVSEDQMHNGGGSNIGFRGREALGGGLNAWFQCETGTQFQSGFNSDGMCTRNSGVGLQGAFGNVMYGHWDLPMKWATISGVKIKDTGVMGAANLFHKGAPAGVANGTFAADGPNVVNITVVSPTAAATTSVGTGTSRSNAAVNNALTTFYRRQSNVVQYWSPNMSGFEVRAAVSASNEEGVPPAVGSNRTPRTYSFGGKYTSGPLLVSLGYEKHNDYAIAGRDDTGWIAAVSYQFGPVRVAAMYEDLKWESFSATQSGDTDTWGLFADWRIAGPHSLRMQYINADDTKGSLVANQGFGSGSTLVFNGGAGQTGASMWGIEYAYDFSKRTAVRLAYARVSNDNQARYGLYTGGAVGMGAPGTDNGAGKSAKGFGLSIDHRF